MSNSAPTPLIPLSGNYVTFPTAVDSGDITIVTWGQNDLRAANYYKLRAWFGKDDRSGPEPKFEPYGTPATHDPAVFHRVVVKQAVYLRCLM
jgi:hypothetical protein